MSESQRGNGPTNSVTPHRGHPVETLGNATFDYSARLILTILGLIGVIVGVKFRLDEALGVCAVDPTKSQCSDAFTYTSTGIVFGGGLVIVFAGFVLASWRHRRHQVGAWFSLGALLGVAAIGGGFVALFYF